MPGWTFKNAVFHERATTSLLTILGHLPSRGYQRFMLGPARREQETARTDLDCAQRKSKAPGNF